MRKIVYLASPYTHVDIGVRHARERAATLVAGKLVLDGFSVIAPITQSHRMAELCGSLDALDHKTWMAVDLPLVAVSHKLFVLRLDGWEESEGVRMETVFARERGIPVVYLNKEGDIDNGK